tara:strand:+ start:335 stop:658 length:324 start_codon:yes stop_codon:yes gene_type:complete
LGRSFVHGLNQYSPLRPWRGLQSKIKNQISFALLQKRAHAQRTFQKATQRWHKCHKRGKMLQTQKKQIPEELSKEISILRELGLEEYEIEYILYLKTKKQLELKWKN